ncbi:glycosyltransferase [Candidatus Berkelbacteria bacterium]|nr:glycosyltransferase [Candidatus Berkelbacteria bacterium]
MQISVIIPVFNSAETIAKALESVVKQTMQPAEIIVVDDGSTDQTARIVKSFQAKIPIRYHYQSNKRQAAARNLGASQAKGDWLAFLDSDDIWLPNKLAVQLEQLKKYPELDGVIGNYKIIEDGQSKKFVPDIIKGENFSPAVLLTANFFWLPVVLIKKSTFVKLNGFDESFRNAEDIDLGFRFCKSSQYRVFPQVIAHYLRRAKSSSQQEIHDINGQKKFYRKVLERSDLTKEEGDVAKDRLSFWLDREELFLIRRAAVLDGQLAGLKRFWATMISRRKSMKAIGLGVLLLIPGSINYLKKTRWKNLDFEA